MAKITQLKRSNANNEGFVERRLFLRSVSVFLEPAANLISPVLFKIM
jgi:hypothetical protein